MERTETSTHGMLRVQQDLKYCWSNEANAEEVGKEPNNIKSYM